MTKSDCESAPSALISRRTALLCASVCLPALAIGCRRSSALSAAKSKEHVVMLSRAIAGDLGEVRGGLPKGAEFLREYFGAKKFEDATLARDALDRARGKVQDLRTAKATFFALLTREGLVLRSDQAPDLLAGKNLLSAFPELAKARDGKYVETRGSIAEAARVRGKPDGQWVAATPVVVSGETLGVYAAGWSWSAYAYRLENHLRTSVRGGLAEREKEPLLYVYILVDKDVFGAPVSPEVNARALGDQHFMAVGGTDALTRELEITERDFGAAFLRVPELGPNVGICVLRSET